MPEVGNPISAGTVADREHPAESHRLLFFRVSGFQLIYINYRHGARSRETIELLKHPTRASTAATFAAISRDLSIRRKRRASVEIVIALRAALGWLCEHHPRRRRASFQSMGAENGSTGSMAFLRRLFREL
jgi:hypothetical protein